MTILARSITILVVLVALSKGSCFVSGVQHISSRSSSKQNTSINFRRNNPLRLHRSNSSDSNKKKSKDTTQRNVASSINYWSEKTEYRRDIKRTLGKSVVLEAALRQRARHTSL